MPLIIGPQNCVLWYRVALILCFSIGAVPSVYITGLKPTVRVEDIAAVFGSIGIIKMDKKTGNPRIKIYRDEAGNPKGTLFVCPVLHNIENIFGQQLSVRTEA